MKTVVLGTGSWGTALAQVLCDNNQEAVLWGISDEEVNDINQNHRNSRYFDAPVSEKLRAVKDIGEVKDCDVILAAVPTMALEDVLTEAAKEERREFFPYETGKGSLISSPGVPLAFPVESASS